MILATVLLLASVQPAPSPAEHDVVVAALKRLRIATQVDGGKVKACQVRVSSGEADIDRTACEATVACFNGGVTQAEPLANCVEVKVAAFVRGRAGE